MSQQLTLHLSDELFAVLRKKAEEAGTPLTEFALELLGRQFGVPPQLPNDNGHRESARGRFRRHFGSIHSNDPTGADNEKIDADLAKEYGDNHETV